MVLRGAIHEIQSLGGSQLRAYDGRSLQGTFVIETAKGDVSRCCAARICRQTLQQARTQHICAYHFISSAHAQEQHSEDVPDERNVGTLLGGSTLVGNVLTEQDICGINQLG